MSKMNTLSDNTNSIGRNMFSLARYCLLLNQPKDKVKYTIELNELLVSQSLVIEPLDYVEAISLAGHPDKPLLVDPKDVPRRNITGLKGRLALVHAIAHIEFNAINLALDAVYRFQNMPRQYYIDWCRVAAEEAQHFTMLSDYLESHGVAYGDYNAHNGLWEMAVKTDKDVMVRMALVPRVLEARGLDVTPSMINKLESTGDNKLISILQKIFDDEIGHVKIGSYWFKKLCQERELNSEKTFLQLIDQYMQGAKFGPFETEAREQAGFSKEEMQALLDRF